MANPWLKKNPFMSLWLSSANRVAGSVRGQVAAEARRQTTSFAHQASNDIVNFWTDAAPGAATPATAARPKKARK
jgi:hypothetical protein